MINVSKDFDFDWRSCMWYVPIRNLLNYNRRFFVHVLPDINLYRTTLRNHCIDTINTISFCCDDTGKLEYFAFVNSFK